MAGRSQRRFIVWIDVPGDLPDAQAGRRWLLSALGEVAVGNELGTGKEA
jgi:hypothetical protein